LDESEFWKSGTLFSNGKGDGTDLDQTNGGDGKWAIVIDSNTGKLQFLPKVIYLTLPKSH
jgi:hypothetical protein